jgi:putative ABC transport system permease protein
MTTFIDDLRSALRTIAKAPGFALAVIAILALGIGGNTAMFSIINQVLLKPLPYEGPARLVFARSTIGGQLNTFVSAPDYYDYREQGSLFEGFSAVLGAAPKATVTGGAEPERVGFTWAEHDFFRTLGVAPAAGRAFTLEESRPGGPSVVMIGASLAERRFGGTRQAIGASLVMDGQARRVVGVMLAGIADTMGRP